VTSRSLCSVIRLEGDVVVEVILLFLVLVVGLSAVDPVQHFHLPAPYFGRVAFLAVLLPAASLDFSFDVNQRALADVLVRDLGQAASQDDAVPLG